jgi:acetyl-CoA C-acetyltransferase
MALKKAGLVPEEVDFWEINEAFAVVPLWNMKALGLEPEKVNVKGGAIALGHPLGATGARLVGSLARILSVEKRDFGLAAICIGGGQGLATLVKRC